MKTITAIVEFIADPLNILIFLFLWVGVALVQTNGEIEVKGLLLSLMAIPAVLGYLIGRRK